VAREIRLSAPWPIPTLWEAGMGEMNYVKIFKHMTKRMREGGRDFTFGMKHQWKPDKQASEPASSHPSRSTQRCESQYGT
jgi:hypothetical protein